MSDILDARGLACPAPVLMIKDALENQGVSSLSVLVDNSAALENVSRFFKTKDFSVSSVEDGEGFLISASRNGGTPAPSSGPVVPHETAAAEKNRLMVMVATDRMGFGDDRLGRKLIVSFIKTLREMGDELWRLVFVNNGAKLTIDGSPVLEDLLAYENEGLTILVCGTCLDHFDLLAAKKVGQTTNMLDIVTAMQVADKVINI